MRLYRTKSSRLTGTSYSEVLKKAKNFYKYLCSSTRRKPYVRSSFFNNEKIFLGIFWSHLEEKKGFRDKTRRLKFFPCGIELIRESRLEPELKTLKNERLYRFFGKSKEGLIFCAQIKENNAGKKYLISIFPYK